MLDTGLMEVGMGSALTAGKVNKKKALPLFAKRLLL
jgi:hypothetical protein